MKSKTPNRTPSPETHPGAAASRDANGLRGAPLGWAACGLAVLCVLVFRRFLTGTAVMMSTDAAITAGSQTFRELLSRLFGAWFESPMLGNAGGAYPVTPSLILLAALPGILWNNLVYGLACLAGALLFVAGFGRRLGAWAALGGAVTACWLGTNFTLLYAGHTFKPYVVLFFIGAVLAAGVPGWLGGILWGGCVGLMFAQQPDVALFFALCAGVHLLFRLWRREGPRPARWLSVLVPGIVVSLLFAAGPLLSGYTLNVKNTVQVQTESPREKWEYVTQWSCPPDETIGFAAPGYFGWRSDSADAPYWGRTGRSAGWEQTGQGFMNLMNETTYLGMIPILFALFALWSCRRSAHRPEILFWAGAALVTLLLAFGKYFPLYALFYKLPVVGHIRNPNKFIQIFQVALAILTAYGLHAFVADAGNQPPKAARDAGHSGFLWVALSLTAVLGLWAFGLTLDLAGERAGFLAQGWPEPAAAAIARAKCVALWHAAAMTALVAAAFGIRRAPRFAVAPRARAVLAAGLALVVAADALWLSRHYVKPMPRSFIEANALTDFLHERLGAQRVALLTQQGFYNVWLTYLLPYQRIPTFNFTAMPRMPEDYKKFLEAGAKNPLRMWQFAAVKYLLGPAAFAAQLPTGTVETVFTYDVAGAPDGGIEVKPATHGAHAVFALRDAAPRYVLLEGVRPEHDEEALARIAGDGPQLNGSPAGAVRALARRAGAVELETQSEVPAVLRAADRWDPDWKATVDGAPAPVARLDFLCLGVPVPAGPHRVRIEYRPARHFVYLQFAGYALWLAALGGWMLLRRTARLRAQKQF